MAFGTQCQYTLAGISSLSILSTSPLKVKPSFLISFSASVGTEPYLIMVEFKTHPNKKSSLNHFKINFQGRKTHEPKPIYFAVRWLDASFDPTFCIECIVSNPKQFVKNASLSCNFIEELGQFGFGFCVYSSVVAIVNIKLWFQSRSWSVPLVSSIIFSISVYILFNIGLAYLRLRD